MRARYHDRPRRAALLVAAVVLAFAACTTGRKAVAPSYPTPPVAARTNLVSTATAMLGQPYRYGGAAPGGFDCSGLVVYSAARAGIVVPRTAEEQLTAGMPIVRGQIEAGDLVFMHLAHKVLHVGIAVDAARFVHAPATGKRVRIDLLDAPPYAAGFLGARRIVAARTIPIAAR